MQLSNWANFFVAEVGASAALTGLVTVAISINLDRILEVAHLPSRAAESLVSLTAVFALCGVALFPGLAPPTLGALAVALAAASLFLSARTQLASRRVGLSFREHAFGALARLASTVPIGIGGLLLLLGSDDGVTWIAAGVIFALAVSVLNAWVLLVEIKR